MQDTSGNSFICGLYIMCSINHSYFKTYFVAVLLNIYTMNIVLYFAMVGKKNYLRRFVSLGYMNLMFFCGKQSNTVAF